MQERETETPEQHLPRHFGQLVGADGHALDRNGCGETLEIWIQVRDGRIEQIRFLSDGCAASMACASAVAVLVEGIEVSEAFALRPERVLSCIRGLPAGEEHAAEFAVATLQKALTDCQENARNPWKKLYR